MQVFFLTLLLSMISVISVGQTGWQRTITNYSRFEYHASNQNWMNRQQSNGWMYFANNKGLLEFDGTRWKTYPINNAKLRAITIGQDQKIYVGGLGQFGYFKPNENGILTYRCLSNNIKKNEIGNIWNIHIIDSIAYFQSDKYVFCYKNNKIYKIKCPRGATCSAYINHQFYIVSSKGIETLLSNKFESVCSTSHIISSKIVKMLSYNGKILLVTSRDGLFVFDGKEIEPFSSPINQAIKDKQLFCACISEDYLAIGTVQDGVYLYSLKNGSIEHISIENGLQNKSILSLVFDNDYNLWIGLDNGIDCIHLDSSYFFLNSSKSVVGAGYSSCVYKSKLYLGTNQGIYTSILNLNPNEDLHLKAVSGTGGQIWAINVIDGDLFGCGSNSLTIINENGTYNVPNIRGVWSVHQLSKDLVIAGTYFGFYILKKIGNRWAVESMIKKGNYSSKSLYIEHSPKGIYIWTANKENGLFRLKLSSDHSQITNSICLNSKELPMGDNVCINEIEGDIIIASRFGLYKYDKLNDKLVRATSLERKLGGGKWYTYIKEDEYKNIWFVENSMLKVYFPNEKTSNMKIKEEYRLRNSMIEDFESVYVLDKKSAIIGTEDGFSLIHYMDNNKTSKLSFQIRDVYLPNKGSVIYERSYIKNNRNTVLSYIDNSIGFRYTTTNYKKLSPNLFSYRLIGSDDEKWSKYSSNNYKEFSNLHEGDYIFQVRTLSDDGKSVMSDSVAFTILPPWYRSMIAYIVYLIILSLVGYYIYNHFNKKFKKQKQEFKKINQIKDNRISTLEQEKLENELRYKSDELIRSSLNIVRKNEILQNIKKEALGLNGSINDSNMAELRRKVLRLINQIDENIAHDDDLKKFQDAFDSANHDFLRLLTERFPELTKRDKLLCVYIKMDLQSKEIAPLLNISLRGVEIGRYRLRKKLMLEERENLLEFLQNI